MKPKFCFRCQHGYYLEHDCRAAGLPAPRPKTTRDDRMAALAQMMDDVEAGFHEVIRRQVVLSVNLAAGRSDVTNYLRHLCDRLDIMEKEIAAIKKNTRPLLQKMRSLAGGGRGKK